MHPPSPAAIERSRLVVTGTHADRVAGTCALVPPQAAARAGGYGLEREFDLDWLAPLRERMVEVGEMAVAPGFREPSIHRLLAEGLARYLIANGLDHAITVVTINAADGGSAAAAIHREAVAHAAAPHALQVFPRRALPLERLAGPLEIAMPPRLRTWLDLGAWVCGEPGLHRDGMRADIPLLLPLARMRSAEARRFLRRAA